VTVGAATIHRHLRAAGLVSPQPQKRPKSSYIRFAAERSAAAALTVDLGRAGVGIHALVPEGATLEELFFELTEEAAE